MPPVRFASERSFAPGCVPRSNARGARKAGLGDNAYAAGKYEEAAALMKEMVLAEECAEFLTLPAYDKYFAD